MVNRCLYCGKDISHKISRAKYCNDLCRLRHSRGIPFKEKRKCLLCGVDISHKIISATYCCREHKSRHYRHINRDKVRKWKQEWSKKNYQQILKNKREVARKEKEKYGFTKKYLREYATRHINDLIKLKGKKCEMCGTRKYLEIHHIKYTKNPKDWIFLCYNCHTKEHYPTTLLQS